MLIARQLGIAPLDGSPTNTKGSSFAHFQPVDLDESARMMSRMKIAEFFENCALKQVGITPQRLGEVQASESATGTQQAVNQSFAQTESYFTNFSMYKTRCMQMGLEMMQYVDSQQTDITSMYIKSDMSRAFIQMNGTDLLFSQLGVFVSDSAEVQRQLEMLRQLFMGNNSTGATPVDLATVVTSNSPNEIKAQIKASYKATQDREAQQAQSEQQGEQDKLKQADQEADKQRAFIADQNDKKLKNEVLLAQIKAIGDAAIGSDGKDNVVPDVMEVQKMDLEMQKHQEDITARERHETNRHSEAVKKIAAEKDRTKADSKQTDAEMQKHKDEMALRHKEIESKEKIAKSKKQIK